MTRVHDSDKNAHKAKFGFFQQRSKLIVRHVNLKQQSAWSEYNTPLDNTDNLIKRLDAIMKLQLTLIEIGELTAFYRRWQMLLIFFQSGLLMVFNTYYLVTYLLRYFLTGTQIGLPLGLSVIYYGSYIVGSAFNVTMTVFAFTMLYNSLQKMMKIFVKSNIFTEDETLKTRLIQYIICINGVLQKYNVLGFYDFDGRLLVAMLSSTATYIVILIQYGGVEGNICALPFEVNETIGIL